jgi:membrane protease YdiL (CAAX protease family)
VKGNEGYEYNLSIKRRQLEIQFFVGDICIPGANSSCHKVRKWDDSHSPNYYHAPFDWLAQFQERKTELGEPWIAKGCYRSFIFLGCGLCGPIVIRLVDRFVYACNSPKFTVLNSKVTQTLVVSFLVGVFIIALWEESVNRGYIQTRLQLVWDFRGMIFASFLFAFIHIPSALLDCHCDIYEVLLRLVQTGLSGLFWGYLYWRIRSVLTTIVVYGLNNFTITGIFPLFSNITPNVLQSSNFPDLMADRTDNGCTVSQPINIQTEKKCSGWEIHNWLRSVIFHGNTMFYENTTYPFSSGIGK